MMMTDLVHLVLACLVHVRLVPVSLVRVCLVLVSLVRLCLIRVRLAQVSLVPVRVRLAQVSLVPVSWEPVRLFLLSAPLLGSPSTWAVMEEKFGSDSIRTLRYTEKWPRACARVVHREDGIPVFLPDRNTWNPAGILRESRHWSVRVAVSVLSTCGLKPLLK